MDGEAGPRDHCHPEIWRARRPRRPQSPWEVWMQRRDRPAETRPQRAASAYSAGPRWLAGLVGLPHGRGIMEGSDQMEV